MPAKKPRRPGKRAHVASLRGHSARVATRIAEGLGRMVARDAEHLVPLLSSGKPVKEEKLKSAEESAREFLKKREEAIKKRRKYVESSVSAGKSPSLKPMPEMHASYIEATQLLKAIEKRRALKK